MKTIIGRIRTAASLAVLIALAAGGAGAVAPTPTVVWDGDFSSLTKTVGDVTYTIDNVTGTGVSTTTANSVGGDKSYLQIANSNKDAAAPIITATGGNSAFGNATDGATVLIFASGMPLTATSNRALLLLMDNTSTYGNPSNGHSRFGIARAKGNDAAGNSYGGDAAGGFVLNGAINTASAPVNTAAYTDGKQSIALTYKGSSGLKYYVDGLKKGEYNPNAEFTPTGVCIGGVDYINSSWFYAQSSMKIHAIAIFNRELTAEEIAEYEAQSRFRYCDAIAWRNAGGGSTEFHESTFASVGSIGEVANSTTRTYNRTGFPWQESFSTGKLPVALVYDQADKQQSVVANFSGLWIGGAYVNAVPASGTYTITAGTGGTRETYLGDKTGNHESWFVFNESYTISRSGASNTANSLLYGTVNMYIAADKTFTLNSVASTSAKNLVMTAGTANTADPVFRMSGGGKLVVPHLNASVGTLDFSGVTVAPFIQGDLTVSANTCLVLPSGTEENASYVLCSGTLTAPAKTVQTTVQVGDGEAFTGYVTYDATTKSVSYSTSAPSYTGTVDGTTITWSEEGLTADDIEGANITLTGSGEVTLPAEPISINAGSGVTVNVTGYSFALLSGAGTFKYTSGYPTTVPEGMTYEYAGGTEESPCVSSDKYTVNGTLKLNGYFTLSGANTVPKASGVLEIASGKSTVTFGSNTAGVTGWIQIDSGAELVAASSDALNYESNSGGIKVYGKLSLGSCRWSFNTNNKFYLYNGGEVSGEGDSTHHCALDFYQSNRILVFGTCTISANVRTRDSDDLLTIAQARGSSLTISGNIIGSGAVKKDYATTAEGNTENNAGNSTTYFSGANTFDGAFTAANNTGYITMRPGVSFNSATAFTIGTGNELDFGKSDGTDSASEIEFNNTVSNSGATKVYCKLTLRSSANATTWGDNFTGTVQVQSTGGLVVPATCTGESSTCNFSIVSGGKLYGGGTVVLSTFPTLTTSVLDSGWTGKVVFPTITSGSADNGFNQKVNAFGNTASTVKLLGLPTTGTSTYFTDNGSVNTTLELAEGCTLRINNGYSDYEPGKTGTIYNLTGAGTLLHAWSPSPSDKMFKISVTTVSNFTGSVQNTSSVTGCDINIGKLHFDSNPVGGARVLSATASGTGKITVGGTNINGLTLVQKSDGFYAAAASYNGENYTTIQEAIDAAGDANLGDIVVADSSAAVPEGYAIVGGTRLRKGGATIYWTSGTYWAASGGNAEFSTALSDGETTTYAAGDTVVIPDTTKRGYGQISDGAKIVFACGGTIDVDKTGDLGYAFKNAEITIESGTTVNFVQDGEGANPEVNGGSISGEGAITVANGATLVFSGEVELGITPSGGTVNVASGAEVSCTGTATISSTLAGRGEISFATLPASALTLGDWTGTVELPVLAANQAYRLNYYGKTGSTIRLNGLSAGWLAVATPIAVNANLELVGDWKLTAMSPQTYNFATVSGTGNMSFAPTGDQPTSINIATLSGYTGTITNNTMTTLAIGTLALGSGADVSACAKLLSTGGKGAFTVAAVTVGGEAQTLTLSYRSDGVYVRGVASYGNVEYETIAEAIAAAVEDGHTYADVTILDQNATCPDGYYVDTGNGNALAKYAAAAVTVGATETTLWCTTFQEAINAAVADNQFTYAVAYADGSATVAGNSMFMLKPGAFNVTVTSSIAGYGDYAQIMEIPVLAGVYQYSTSPAAATFTWTGAAGDNLWATAGNWSSADGRTVDAGPANSLYTVVLDTAATIALSGNVNIGTVNVGAAVTVQNSGAQHAVLNASSIVLTAAGASIAASGVSGHKMTLAVTPTTAVANSYVKATTSDSTTTYRVDVYNTVTFAGDNYTLGSVTTNGAAVAVSEGTCKVEDGTITFTVAPNSGYAVTGVTATTGTVTESNGVYSYTVTQDATITVTTVSTAVTFSEVEFDYYVGYGSAKSVTAKVTGQVVEGTAWTLTVGETEYAGGVYDSATGKVTWTPANGIANLAAGQALSYSIAATGGSMGTLADQQTTVGNVVDGWIAEDAAHSDTGTWSPSAPVFGEADRAALSGETTFTANSQASGKVTLTTVVNFGNEAAPTLEISADAKAAIKVENNSFKIWTKTTVAGEKGASADWLTVSGATPNLAADSTVVFTFDTDAKTFTVSVGGNALYYGASNANTLFAFASDGVAISSVAYKGAGSFTSLTGEYTTTDIAQTVDGKGVVVANSFISGNETLRAMTIEAATAALAPNSTATCSNGYNYFTNYALGLDPTKADDKPIVDVTTDTEGKFVFTVKHRNAAGELVEITPADNVSTTVTLKYGTDANTQSWESAEGTSFAPNALPFGENNNVLYYKAEVKIGAK